MTISPQTRNWLRQSAALDGAVVSQTLLNLLERVEALEQRPTCKQPLQVPPAPEAAPVATDEEVQKVLRAYDRYLGRQRGAAQPPAAQPAPVATDDELLAMRSWSSHGPTFDSDLVEFGRACYDLDRQHGAAQPPAAQPAPPVMQRLMDAPMDARGYVDLRKPPAARPTPEAASPAALRDALIKAECALSDIAEGEPEYDEGDPAQWAEQRCAETLAIIRPVMKQHKIRTSEWPHQPLPQVGEAEG